MYTIVRKDILSETVKLMDIEAVEVARKGEPGQFAILRIDEKGERIPLTIADSDPVRGTITIIFQEVGKSTRQLGALEVGDRILNFMGPLGHPTEIENFGTVICVAGGVGIAPMFPITRALKKAGNRVIAIIGARDRSLLFWEDRMRAASDELIVCTDDGSAGRKDLVTAPLKEILQSGGVARAWAIGPAVMMKFCVRTAEPFGIPIIVSLNTVMVDGTGMCGGCRVSLKNGAQFVCVDGPEFDGREVDWDLLLSRQAYYRVEEAVANTCWDETCRALAAARVAAEV